MPVSPRLADGEITGVSLAIVVWTLVIMGFAVGAITHDGMPRASARLVVLCAVVTTGAAIANAHPAGCAPALFALVMTYLGMLALEDIAAEHRKEGNLLRRNNSRALTPKETRAAERAQRLSEEVERARVLREEKARNED